METFVESEINWLNWLSRWEEMQSSYIPQRLYRFDLMLALPDFEREAPVAVLDLGCGPGSLSFRALLRYPHGRIVAVDMDPLLLRMGRKAAGQMGAAIEFFEADLRDPQWWARFAGTFDLIASTTALHWLNEESLRALLTRIFEALKPGGWFLNSDHVASDNPEMQKQYREILKEKQQFILQSTGADSWDGFWDALRLVCPMDVPEKPGAPWWEGSDDGQPRRVWLEALAAAGFRDIDFFWQDLGEAVVGARKPLE
jgi:SAM-dependent methyltransferase